MSIVETLRQVRQELLHMSERPWEKDIRRLRRSRTLVALAEDLHRLTHEIDYVLINAQGLDEEEAEASAMHLRKTGSCYAEVSGKRKRTSYDALTQKRIEHSALKG